LDIVCGAYGFELDADPYTVGGPKDLLQKVGVSDYEFVKGLANITGYIFWVDADEKGVWTLHFKDPEKMVEQEKKYTFKYNFGDGGTLLSFKPEVLIKGAKTKIVAKTMDPFTGKVLAAEIEETDAKKSPELEATGDQDGPVEKSYPSGSAVKLYLNDFAFEVVSTIFAKPFTNS